MSVYGRESDSPYHSEIAVHHQRVKSAYRPKQSASAKRSLYAVLFDAEQAYGSTHMSSLQITEHFDGQTTIIFTSAGRCPIGDLLRLGA